MKYGRTRYLLAIAFACGFLNPGCSPSEKPTATINLIALQEVAREEVETGIVDLTALKRYYYLAHGWAAPQRENGETERSTAAVLPLVRYRFTVVKPADRWFIADIGLTGSWGTLQRQRIELTVNGTAIGAIDIDAGGVKEAGIFIPKNLQRRGTNEIIMAFAEYRKNADYLKDDASFRANPYPGVAAYFSNIRFVIGGKRQPWPLELQREEDALSLAADGKILAQRPNSAISFGEMIPSGASLRFFGNVQTPANKREKISIRIFARTSAAPEGIELWHKKFDSAQRTGSDSFAATVDLGPLAGEATELVCEVLCEQRPSNLLVLWKELSILYPRPAQPAAVARREPARAPAGVRHVIVIVNDAWRADQAGFNSGDPQITPHNDALAREGIVFTSAVSAASYTIASAATMFSGQEPETHGVSHGFQHDLRKYPDEMESLPWAFGRKGYHTLILTGNPFITTGYGLATHADDLHYLMKDSSANKRDRPYDRSTMDMDRVEAGIRKAAKSGKPVFIYAHFLPPHWPYNPPAPFDRTFGNLPPSTGIEETRVRQMIPMGLMDAQDEACRNHFTRYRNNVRYADQVNRDFLDLLQKYGLLAESMVIVTSDHGEEFGEKGVVEHSQTTNEGVIHVPFLVHYPGAPAMKIDRQIGLLDLFPTLAELFALDVREGHEFEGRSLAPLFLGREMPAADYYFSIASGHKLSFSLRGERYKYVFHLYQEALYDLQTDPQERVNIISRYPGLAAWLRQRGMLRLRPYRKIAAMSGEKVILDEQTENDLRNLGYLQ